MPRSIVSSVLGLFMMVGAWVGPAVAKPDASSQVLTAWYGLVLDLVRHTATYSPPVASRSFGYLGVTAYEAVASGRKDLRSLAGQLNGLGDGPMRPDGLAQADAVVLNAALREAVRKYFGNTGPTGQRAIERLSVKMTALAGKGVKRSVMARAEAHGIALAEHVFKWSEGDGGAVIANLGFPESYALNPAPGHWVPTNPISLQQMPLLPNWKDNRPFAMPSGAACRLPAPTPYSEDKATAFYALADEVYRVSKGLTDEQKTIARFWSDDPMLSTTPPGHWISIALQIFKRDNVPVDREVEILARLGVAMADAFIGCWQAKFEHDLLRPLTYIRKHIDTNWQPLLITPPFPEFPSGHSTLSGAAAFVLTQAFGADFAFDDGTYVDDGMAGRHFASFDAAASEAAISRLYGGIHFREAIERGIDQGHCIGAFAVALKVKK